MSTTMLKGIAGLFLLTLFSCNPEENKTEVKYFFDLESIIQQEIAWLDTHKPEVQKFVKINDKTEAFQTKDIDWKKELEIILQSDINKAAYRLSYDTKETENEISYYLKEGENLPVNSLTILKNEKGEVIKVISEHTSDNYLYSSHKNIIALFQDGHLSYYDIKGYQMLFVGGKKNFEINGKL